MMESIVTRGAARTFAGADGPVHALEPVDMSLYRGQLVVVSGPSGCGKSTLLNLLGLLDQPSEGTLWVEGEEVTRLGPRALADVRRKHIGFLFQDAGLIDRMTVMDNVRMPLKYRSMPSGARRARAELALEEVSLTHRLRALVDTLSGGERQRVGLARLLAVRPNVMICDEPTASLDEANSRLVTEHLARAAAGGACVVCASHDPIVMERADRRITLARGRIANDSRPAVP